METAEAAVEVEEGKTATFSPRLKPDAVAGNLVRNPRFEVRWIKPDRPDGWTRDPVKQGRWASAPVRVPVDQACTLRVEFVPDKQVPVKIRWRTNPSSTADSREMAVELKGGAADLRPDPLLRRFEKGVLFLEVLVETDGPAEAACRHVAVTFVPKEK
jgi:hypothetical protein